MCRLIKTTTPAYPYRASEAMQKIAYSGISSRRSDMHLCTCASFAESFASCRKKISGTSFCINSINLFGFFNFTLILSTFQEATRSPLPL